MTNAILYFEMKDGTEVPLTNEEVAQLPNMLFVKSNVEQSDNTKQAIKKLTELILNKGN